MVSNGGSKFHWAWKSVRMTRVDHGILSWDLSPRRRTGEGWTIGNDSISRTLDFVNSDFYLCLELRIRQTVKSKIYDYTCCFFEIINLGSWWLKRDFLTWTDVKSIDLQNRLHLYYWNCEFRSWWLERLLDLNRLGI